VKATAEAFFSRSTTPLRKLQGEWIREDVFRGKRELLRHAAALLQQYMGKDLIREKEFFASPHAKGALPPAQTEW
jgi:hypothetical protein